MTVRAVPDRRPGGAPEYEPVTSVVMTAPLPCAVGSRVGSTCRLAAPSVDEQDEPFAGEAGRPHPRRMSRRHGHALEDRTALHARTVRRSVEMLGHHCRVRIGKVEWAVVAPVAGAGHCGRARLMSICRSASDAAIFIGWNSPSVTPELAATSTLSMV